MVLIDGFIPQKGIIAGVLDDTKNPYNIAKRKDIKDQYMFGESILVAPVFTGQQSRKVILPKGKWYDFYTGKYVGENEIINVDTKLDEIPLYVKDGGIIPMIASRLHAPKNGELLPLEVRYYGTVSGSFLLYDDDGETYDYEKGTYSWTKLSVSTSKEGKLIGDSKRISGNIFNYKDITWKFMGK